MVGEEDIGFGVLMASTTCIVQVTRIVLAQDDSTTFETESCDTSESSAYGHGGHTKA